MWLNTSTNSPSRSGIQRKFPSSWIRSLRKWKKRKHLWEELEEVFANPMDLLNEMDTFEDPTELPADIQDQKVRD